MAKPDSLETSKRIERRALRLRGRGFFVLPMGRVLTPALPVFLSATSTTGCGLLTCGCWVSRGQQYPVEIQVAAGEEVRLLSKWQGEPSWACPVLSSVGGSWETLHGDLHIRSMPFRSIPGNV